VPKGTCTVLRGGGSGDAHPLTRLGGAAGNCCSYPEADVLKAATDRHRWVAIPSLINVLSE